MILRRSNSPAVTRSCLCAGYSTYRPKLTVKKSWKNMHFHSKMAWQPVTYDVICRNHSNWPSLNLSQKVREGERNRYGKRQVLIFYRRINCVHNCKDHSSFDFIPAVLTYDLFHMHLSMGPLLSRSICMVKTMFCTESSLQSSFYTYVIYWDTHCVT